MALRKVHGYPVWVSVGVRMKRRLQASWTTSANQCAVGLVLTLVILGAMEHILRSEAAAAQKAKQLDLTLEHINQGIMLVTKDRRSRSSTSDAASCSACPKN